MRQKSRQPGQSLVSDYGLDGLVKDKATCCGVQAKYYHGHSVAAASIGSFLAAQWTLTLKNPFSVGYLYASSKLQVDLAGHIENPLYPIKYMHFPWKPIEEEQKVVLEQHKECDFTLYPHQLECKEFLVRETGINGLYVPCRMGKTVISGHIVR